MKSVFKSLVLFSFLFLFRSGGFSQTSQSKKVVFPAQSETIKVNQNVTKVFLEKETLEILNSLENSSYVVTLSPIGSNDTFRVLSKTKEYFEVERINFNSESQFNIDLDYIVFVNGYRVAAPTHFATSIHDK